MQLIKTEKKTFGKIEQAKVVLSIFCLLSDIKLSDTELTVLGYFLVYRDSPDTRDLIIKSQILKTQDSLSNSISKLKKFGLLKKDTITKTYSVNEKVNFQSEPVVAFLIKIDNT
jgi:hypothetical protein